MAQSGYKSQWGSPGRDDFGIMSRMGANFIRLYHPIGVEVGAQPNHTEFLDAAQAKGLNVFGGVHQYLSCQGSDGDDCFTSWSAATEEGLKAGFASNGSWHSAAWAINIINEVDAIVAFDAPAKQVKRLISAVDGMMAAEKKLNVTGTVNLTSCFTTALASPLGGGPATIYHGFSSMEAWIKKPRLINYTTRSVASIEELARLIDRRWVHCLNAQMPWTNGLDNMIASQYDDFMPRPWFLGEMGWNGIHKDAIETELNTMIEFSKKDRGYAGTFAFQFQTAYQKGLGSEMNYGMFSLGAKELNFSTDVNGVKYPVQCLTPRLFVFDNKSGCPDCNHRAEAIAKSFNGTLAGRGLCLNARPVGPKMAIVV